MFEVQATYKNDEHPVVLRTDDGYRARTFVAALQGNDRYTRIVIVMNNRQLTREDFLSYLEDHQ